MSIVRYENLGKSSVFAMHPLCGSSEEFCGTESCFLRLQMRSRIHRFPMYETMLCPTEIKSC